jgi:hypothetical protein
MIGCAGMIAAVAFIFGVIGSLFATKASLTERLMIALIPAACAFVAALILFTRDHARHTSTMRAVRNMLLARNDVNDHEFFAHFADTDSTLIAQTRQAISGFFDVPAKKIHATDRLHNDLRFGTLEPAFHSFVVYHVLNVRNVVPHPFTFNTADLTDIGDLAKEIQRVLDGLDTPAPSDNGVKGISHKIEKLDN